MVWTVAEQAIIAYLELGKQVHSYVSCAKTRELIRAETDAQADLAEDTAMSHRRRCLGQQSLTYSDGPTALRLVRKCVALICADVNRLPDAYFGAANKANMRD